MFRSWWICPLIVAAMLSGAAFVGAAHSAAGPQAAFTTCPGRYHAVVGPGPDAERQDGEWINRTSNVREHGTTCADAQSLVRRYARKTCGGCVRHHLDGYSFTVKTLEKRRYTTLSLVTGTHDPAVVKFEFKAHDCGCVID